MREIERVSEREKVREKERVRERERKREREGERERKKSRRVFTTSYYFFLTAWLKHSKLALEIWSLQNVPWLVMLIWLHSLSMMTVPKVTK